MGNSPSELLAKAAELSDVGLEQTSKEDLKVLSNPWFILNTIDYMSRTDLNYDIPGQDSQFKKEETTTVQEESLICSMHSTKRMREKHADTCKSLLSEILQQKGEDKVHKENITKLQAFARLYDALIRNQERALRVSRKEESEKVKTTGFSNISKVAVVFGLNSMLNLVKCVGGQNPGIYKRLITQTSEILSNTYPCSIASPDPVYIEALTKVSSFFEAVLRGEVKNVTEENRIDALSPLFAIGLSSGNLSSLLSIILQFISTRSTPGFVSTLKLLHGNIKVLQHVPSSVSYLSIGKSGSNITLKNSSTCAEHKTTNYNLALSEQEFTSGHHYVEFVIEKTQSNLSISVCDSVHGSANSDIPTTVNNFLFQGSGNIISKGAVLYNWEAWKPNDRIGVEIDMDKKAVTFYKNGKPEPKPLHEGLADSVRLIIVMYDTCRVRIENFCELPTSVHSRIYEKEPKSESRKVYLTPDESYLSLSCFDFAGIVMKELIRLNNPLLSLFKNLYSLHIPSKIGVAFHVHESTLTLIAEIIEKLLDLGQSSEATITEFLVNSLQLLKAHLLASITQKDFKLSKDLKSRLYSILEKLSENPPNQAANEESNEILGCCFEIFFTTPAEKLSYLLQTLRDIRSGKDLPENILALHDKIFKEMASPFKLFSTLAAKEENQFLELNELLELMLEISYNDSVNIVDGSSSKNSMIRFLEVAQLVLFAQAATDNYSGKWQEVLSNYSVKFINNVETLVSKVHRSLKDGKLPDELATRLEDTIAGKATTCLLNILILCKMHLDFLSKLLPALGSLIASVALFPQQPGKMMGGVSIAHELYESTHNYADGLNISHTIAVPFAKKYTLKFDAQCKTENGCDYLELWTSESKVNKIARWEGEGFPKEPFVYEGPVLHFTFHSDGSVNYWGWRIEIDALVECEFLQQVWPETIKEACGVVIGSISHKLISGDFDTEAEDENIAKVLENPLLMYGIQDKYLTIVKTPEPLNESLFVISTTPGIVEKFKPVMLTRAYSEDVSRRVIRSQDLARNLGDYVEEYGNWGHPRFTDDAFIQELVEGSESIQKTWEQVKRKAMVIGPESIIGGREMDQSERAIFAVYVSYFSISSSIKKLFENPGEISPTLKFIIKTSSQIRIWASKQKQKQYDSGNTEVTYTQISDSIVKKCCFLLAAEYKKSLTEIGISNIQKKLASTVKSYSRSEAKEDSKWGKVSSAIETSKKLKGLVNISKTDNSASPEQEELNRIIELVNSFLESSVAIEKIVEAIEKRRSKAIARTLGFLCLANLLNFAAKHETWLVRAFSTALKSKGKKEHYWKGLEGSDPFLLECLQKAFFQVYGLLQKELIKSRARPFTMGSYSHYISVIEAMSCPFRAVDAQMILELQFPSTLHILFSWAKGYIGEEVISRPFIKENCVTEFSLVTGGKAENRLLIEEFEDKPSVFIQFEKGGASQPVSDFFIIPSEANDRPAELEFEINQVKHKLVISREQPVQNSSYLTSFDGLNPIMTKYEDLLGSESPEDKAKREDLKIRLAKSSWALYKLIMFSIVGTWAEYSEKRTDLVQEMFVKVLFAELKWDEAGSKPDDKDLSISEAASGELWLGKMTAPKCLQKNPMVEWMRVFTKEVEPFGDLMIKSVISEYIEKVDPVMKGVISETDLSYLDPETSEKLKQFEDNRNSRGQYDFFRYLQGLSRLSYDLPFEVQDYVENSSLWKDIPEDFYEASKDFNYSNIERILENCQKWLMPHEEGSFKKLIERFTESDSKGIIEKANDEDPAEFKNSSGKLDFFVTLHAIFKNPEKFSTYFLELERVHQIYDDLPPTCEEIYKERHSHEDYVTSLMWTLLGCFGSESLSHVLSKPEFFEEILKITFLSKSEKTVTLGYRILAHILPFNHSPATLLYSWKSLSRSLPHPDRCNFVTYLFRKIGRGLYSYGSSERIKLQMRWLYETQNLILALSANERWNSEISKTLVDLITESIEFLLGGKQLEYHHTGAVLFLGSVSKFSDSLDLMPIELSVVNLVDSSLASAVIKKFDGTNAVLYSVIEDSAITEPRYKISKVQPYIMKDFYENLNGETKSMLSEILLKFWNTVQSSKEFSSCKEPVSLIRILYEKLATSAIVAYTAIIEHVSLSNKQIVDIMCTISNTYIESKPPDKEVYETVVSLVSAANRTEKKAETNSEISEEEAYKRLSQMKEEDQIVASELLSIEVPISRIIKCFDKGIKDMDGVLGYVEPVVEEKQAEYLYQLSLLNSVKILDPSGLAEIYQNSMSHFVIVNKAEDESKKEIIASFSKNIFHSTKQLPESITIVAALEGRPNSSGLLTFGLKIGTLTYELSNRSGLSVITLTGSDYPIDKVLLLRIYANPTGEVQIINERSGEVFKTQNSSVYNGIKIGDFGIYLEEGQLAELLLFDIHVGKYSNRIDKVFERPKGLEGGERYLRVKHKARGTDRSRLKLLGFNDEEIVKTITSTQNQTQSQALSDLQAKLSYCFENFFSNEMREVPLEVSHELVVDVLVVDSIENIPKGYKKIPVLDGGVLGDLDVPGQRLVVYKKETYKAGKVCTGFSVLEEAPEHTNIGELSLNIEGEHADWPTPIFAKLALPKQGESSIKDIIFYKTSTINSIVLPYGFHFIVDKEQKAINIAPKKEKSFYLFAAVLKDDTLLDAFVTPYNNVKASSTSFGLVDKFDLSSVKKSESTKEYEDMSTVEQVITLFEFENSRNQETIKRLFISLAKKSETVFMQILQDGNTQVILNILKDNLKELATVFDNLFKSNEGAKVREKIVLEITRGLLCSIVADEIAGSKSLRSLTIEGAHPYDNNMDVDQVITIPGASGLRIVFDPQCHTEIMCDLLTFYKSSGRQGELDCFSGPCEAYWPPFEVQNDTVHLYFHSDGSAVYWGYKFEVIPLVGSKVKEESPEISLWLLQRIVNMEVLPIELEILMSPRFLRVLFVLSLTSSSVDYKQACIDIIRKLLRGQQHEEIQKILNIFVKEAGLIHEKHQKDCHPILQSLIHLIASTSKSYSIKITDEWLINFTELLSDMRGLCDKDENLEYFLFERYKARLSKALTATYESEHPYKRVTHQTLLKAPLASFISIEFDEKSSLDPRDEILFTYDSEMTNVCKAKSGGMGTVSGIGWDNTTKGPDIVITNDGATVTRTNSSSWGCAQWTELIATGIVKITFHIDYDGGSDYLYIGVANVADFPTLSSCVNSDLGKDLWVWKRSGEVHKRGSSSAQKPYKTGDTISMQIDMVSKEICFIKDDQEFYRFSSLSDEVRPIICFGGSNQLVTVVSVEKTGGHAEINKRTLKIPGDTVYCSFPVNIGATKDHRWKVNNTNSSCDPQCKVLTKIVGEKSIHSTGENLTAGKNLIEVVVNSLGKVALGFALNANVETKDLDNYYTVLYNSDGIVTYHREEVKVEEFTMGDVISCFFDFDRLTLAFYKNGRKVFDGISEPLENGSSLNLVAVLNDEKQSLSISGELKFPIDVELIRNNDPAATNTWGYKFNANFEFKGRGSEITKAVLKMVSQDLTSEWSSEYLPKFSTYFKNGVAEQLVMYLDEWISKVVEKHILKLAIEDINPTPEELIFYPDLEKVPIDDMRELYQILLLFNNEISKDMNMINLHIESNDDMSELQRVFMGSRNFIFFNSKYSIFKEILGKTNSDSRPEITVDRPKAMRHRHRKDVDTNGQFSIYGQIFRAINLKTNQEFRNSERIFRVTYRGEAATDAGGPYNEVISNMCDELQSSFLNLLIPTPNNSHNMGENRDCWIVNPSANTSVDYDMFFFLGKMMGVAIRTQNNLNLSLPPLFWKRLLLDQVNIKDLRSIDVCLVQILEILRNPEANKITPETFADSYDEKFTTKDTSGKEVELKEGGKGIQVSYENAKEYSELVEKLRLNENQKAYEMIRKGMSAVIPMDYLNLLSWRQVQTLVCGAPDINIDILKENTQYESCNENQPHIGLFWEVLREMNTKEKSLYLKFVWGRSRLPAGRDFRKMKIATFHSGGNVNNYLPVSHTCFFTIDLPAYTTKDAMRSKLLYAITHCTAIDLDGTASGGWEEND